MKKTVIALGALLAVAVLALSGLLAACSDDTVSLPGDGTPAPGEGG